MMKLGVVVELLEQYKIVLARMRLELVARRQQMSLSSSSSSSSTSWAPISEGSPSFIVYF